MFDKDVKVPLQEAELVGTSSSNTWPIALVVRDSSLPYTTYVANCPCGEGLIVIPSPVAIPGKGFEVAFFGKRLIVALLDICILLGVLALLALGNVHIVFGVLTVPNLSVFTPLIAVLCNMVVVASCK